MGYSMTKINKPFLNSVRADINAALNSVGEKHGLALSIQSIRYSDTGFNTTLKATVNEDSQGNSIDPDKIEFEKYAAHMGFDSSAFGKTFEQDGKAFIVSGIAPRARKFPILATHSGTQYKFPISVLDKVA